MEESVQEMQKQQVIQTWSYNFISPALHDLLSITIEWDSNDNKSFSVLRTSDSKIEWERFGLNIKRNIPVYFLQWRSSQRKGGYDHENDIIILFENVGDYVLKHELVHSIEMKQSISEELNSFYEKSKKVITEDSFSDGYFTFNFMKHIHEFIADGYSNDSFINAMKKENLYDEFLEKTQYLEILV